MKEILQQTVIAYSQPDYLKIPFSKLGLIQILNAKTEVSILKRDKLKLDGEEMVFIQHPPRSYFRCLPGESTDPQKGKATVFAWVPASWVAFEDGKPQVKEKQSQSKKPPNETPPATKEQTTILRSEGSGV